MRITRGAAATAVAPLLFTLVGALAPKAAVAGDDPDKCYESYEQAQLKKREGNPRAARQLSRTCARDVCPAFVRGDCIEWLDQAERAVPTVVLEAHTDEGDASEARVTIDDAPLATRLDGRAIEVDPGVHVFRFVVKEESRDVRVVIKEGEKSRSVSADFRTSPKFPNAVVQGPMRRPVPAATWGAAGLGAAGLIGFGTFAILGSSKYGSLKESCAPFCRDDQTASAHTMYLIADISLGVGVAGSIAALVLYVTRPSVEAPPDDAPAKSATAIRIVPGVAPGAGRVDLVGSF